MEEAAQPAGGGGHRLGTVRGGYPVNPCLAHGMSMRHSYETHVIPVQGRSRDGLRSLPSPIPEHVAQTAQHRAFALLVAEARTGGA